MPIPPGVLSLARGWQSCIADLRNIKLMHLLGRTYNGLVESLLLGRTPAGKAGQDLNLRARLSCDEASRRGQRMLGYCLLDVSGCRRFSWLGWQLEW